MDNELPSLPADRTLMELPNVRKSNTDAELLKREEP
jgi:hypothetical protein